MTWLEYHELTKHSRESVQRTRHYLDWANMPNPFRHYEGVPVLDLPADPPPPQISALEVLESNAGSTLAGNGAEFLSQLTFYSASISASKRVPSTGATYALRVNPSSGNLHPTEFHFCTRGLIGWPNGLYHYRPSSHMAEQRGIGDFAAKLVNNSSPLIFVLTSIAWREAWKYRDRAYRYCLHDIGHAWQALTLAARSMGCESFAQGHFPDDGVAETCLLSADEWPMLIVGFHGPSIPVHKLDAIETLVFGGQPNRLSEEQKPYPLIERIHIATKLTSESTIPSLNEPKVSGCGEVSLPRHISTNRTFGDVVRTRRSALDFKGGRESISVPQLATLLSPTRGGLFADFATLRFVCLYLYVH
jgi:SagB-type dehydrogenase family enzyme